jgi:hypothetical protein
MMNCAQFEEALLDLDRPGTEGFASREEALAHAESCSSCGQLMTQSESLDLALHKIAQRTSETQAPAHLEKLLREEFRRQLANREGGNLRWQSVLLAMAAGLLLALGFSLHYWSNRQAFNKVSVSPITTSAANEAGASELAMNTGDWEEAATNNQSLDSDSATDFVALPYADDSMAGEGGAIVRVVLSRQALASLGMPVTDLGSADRIPADIVVSEDGAPQAIRLVAQSDVDE